MMFELRKPSLADVPSYVEALERGWSPSNVMSEKARGDALAKIKADPATFITSLDDPEAKGGDVEQPDGSFVPRLPGFSRIIWDGTFCGVINFRWQSGTEALPPSCLGHIGYSVVPWKQRRGYSTQALALLLPEAKARSLAYVEITTDPANIPSQKVILANGGKLIERFRKPAAYGGAESLRYRIDLYR
jgi:predicted acetyltransferase